MIVQNATGTDKAKWHKSDTSGSASVHTTNENPGALAGATGAHSTEQAFKSERYSKRAEATTSLCHAIAECHRDDAVIILDAALASLSMGSPMPVFLSAMDDARWWASYASPAELKAYALACFEAMAPKVQSAFLSHVQRRTAA